jgi:hypothetical protein
VLLREVILRFRKGVETQRLAGVSVEDDDYAQVYAGMTKCSNYAHDKALVGGIAIPEPDELQLNDNLTYVPQNPGLGSSSSLLPLHLAPLRNFSIK